MAEETKAPLPRLDSIEDILASGDAGMEVIPVPEWNGTITLRRLSGKERDAFEDSMYQTRGKKREINLRNFRARLAALCIVSSTPITPAHVERLGDKSAIALTRVVKKAMSMNGFDDDDLEDLTKNS